MPSTTWCCRFGPPAPRGDRRLGARKIMGGDVARLMNIGDPVTA